MYTFPYVFNIPSSLPFFLSNKRTFDHYLRKSFTTQRAILAATEVLTEF